DLGQVFAPQPQVVLEPSADWSRSPTGSWFGKRPRPPMAASRNLKQTTSEPLTDSRPRYRVRSRLLRWFDRHRRPLPWRRDRDPYRIWVSEVMLQQTQVAAVVPYFERFLAAFPDLQSLAGAREADVLRLWEGL